MNAPNLYGESLASEKIAEENQICRGMVKEILDFNVNQRQIMMIIYLLGLELENIEAMRAVTGLVKEIESSALLIGDTTGEQ